MCVAFHYRTLQVTTSATPSCPTRDLWTRCSWMRNLARRLPSVRPEEAAEEACEEDKFVLSKLPLVSPLSSPCSTSPIACVSYWEGYKKMPRFLSIEAFGKTPPSSTNVTNML
ncbi:hypothetical protein PRIPAC_93442 [Pristionchus pacificus]|uniref:Uncharacterized protein n=1 Tax=Pristionchus pacificus TaxID=54126 RepID=A0A2A6CDW5_PRIPA|nr:hypothetical protein PRIPAC_93442 [Pristionchus pacificus]|eukprot:PDM76280.1 hypothetical protein PRIPAC_39884 [Pristionchus pacificus]